MTSNLPFFIRYAKFDGTLNRRNATGCRNGNDDIDDFLGVLLFDALGEKCAHVDARAINRSTPTNSSTLKDGDDVKGVSE